jgi:hypothetical protein
MASRYYLLKPCRTTPAFISTLKNPTRLDLGSCRRRLQTAGFDTEDIQVMLIVGGEPEATLYESGKVLVRTSDAEAARTRVDAIYSALGLRDAAA